MIPSEYRGHRRCQRRAQEPAGRSRTRRRWNAHSSREEVAGFSRGSRKVLVGSRRLRHLLGTFQFVKLRLGQRCVPAVEVVAGGHSLVEELPEAIEPDALRAWLSRLGLLEIRPHGEAQ